MRVTSPQSVRFTLQRVPLDRDGYDSSGSYWGVGSRLYWCASDDGAINQHFRAADRDAAKAKLRQTFPNATFYR